MDQPAFILFLLIGFVVWAVIGHVFWLIGRALFRILTGKEKETQTAPRDVSISQLERDVRQLYLQGRLSQEQLVSISKIVTPKVPSETPPDLQTVAQVEDDSSEAVVAEVVEAEVVDEPEVVSPTASPEPSELSIEERAKIYAQRRHEAAVPEPTAVAENDNRVASEPNRTTSEWLSAFLESANIRWGELVGGLLIVSCSTALVISFWGEISSRPLLKFGVFNSIIGLLFLVGIYAHRRWKLPSTSQGVLTIALHLVPLNFLAIAAFTQAAPPTSWTILGELISIVVLTGLGFLAAQILTPRWAIETTIVGTILPVAQLLIRRWIGEDSTSIQITSMLGCVIGLYAGAFCPIVWKLRKEFGYDHESLEEPSADKPSVVAQSWLTLGIGSFALTLCIAFLIMRTRTLTDSLLHLSHFAGLLAAPAMSLGTIIWKRSRSLGHAWIGLSSAAVTVASIFILCLAVAFAWPNPISVTVSCVVVVVCASVLALLIDSAMLHYLAMPFLWIAVLLLAALVNGELEPDAMRSITLMRSLFSPSTGVYTILASLFAGFFGLILNRRRWSAHALVHFKSAAGFAVVAIAFAMLFGFGRAGDPARLLWILTGCSAIVAVSAFALHEENLLWGAAVLLAILFMQAFVFSYPVHQLMFMRIAFAGLVFASVVSVAAMIVKRLHSALYFPLQSAGVMGAILCTVFLVLCLLTEYNQINAWYVGWLALNWLVLSLVGLSPGFFVLFQSTAFVALVIGINQWQATQDWSLPGGLNWLHPFSLQAHAILCGAFFLFWWAFRFGLVRWQKIQGENAGNLSFLHAKQVDYVVLCAGVVILLFIASSSVIPGAAQELHLVDDVRLERSEIGPEQFWYSMPHSTPRHPVVWCAVASVCFATLAGVRQRYDSRIALWISIFSLILATFCCSLLIGAFAEPSGAVASAVRWTTSLFFGLSSICIWLWHRQITNYLVERSPNLKIGSKQIARFCFPSILTISVLPIGMMVLYVVGSAFARRPPDPLQLKWMFASVVVVGCFLTVFVLLKSKREANALLVVPIISSIGFVALVLLTTIRAISDYPIFGPDPASIFRRMGFLASYVCPIAIYAVGFIGFAHFFRSPRLALAAGVLVNVCGTAAFLFLRRMQGFNSPTLFFHLSQFNAILSAVGMLCWSVWTEWASFDSNQRSSVPFNTQKGIAIGFLAIPLTAVAGILFVNPTTLVPLQSIAGFWGWSSLAAVVFCIWRCSQSVEKSNAWIGISGLIGISIMVACESNRLAAAWSSYHVLLASWAVLSPLLIFFDHFRTKKGLAFVGFHVCALFVLVAFSLRCLAGDPNALPWSVGGLIAASISALAIAFMSNRATLFALSILVCNLLGSVWWIQTGGSTFAFNSLLEWLADLGRVNVIAISVPIALWSFTKASRTDESSEARMRRGLVAFRLVAIWSLCFISLITTVLALSTRRPLETNPYLGWASVLICTLAVLSGLRWRRPGRIGVLAYIAGFCSVGIFLENLRIQGDLFIWSSCLALSAYGILSSYLATCQKQFQGIIRRLHLKQAESSIEQIKLFAILLALGVIWLGFWTLFSCPLFAMRLAAAQSILVQALAMAFLARGKRIDQLRYLALTIVAVSAVAFGWCQFPPSEFLLLDRIVRFAVSMIVVSLVYSLAFGKRLKNENPWSVAAIRCLPVTLSCMIVAIAVVLGIESFSFVQNRSIEISQSSIFAMIAILVAAMVMCMVFAVWPSRNPLRLNTKQLGWYVYAAEAFGVMLTIHLRTSIPWLFQGVFERVWPLLIVAIAFVGVALSEIFRRQQRPEIATPFENTGALLPLLPAFGYWFVPSSVNFSLLMFTTTALYAILCSLRKSVLFGTLATIAGNFGLWHFVYQQGITIREHPQVWLIPPAVCLLVAASMNRNRLTNSQFVAVRYFAASMIYVSSTADIFINGVADAPWLPIVLAAISILGIFLGIMFRVRAFLFLGISFLMVSMLTVVWHAAVDLKQTWLWYVCGIAAGILILAIFAVFEKKRQQVLEIMGKLQDWDT